MLCKISVSTIPNKKNVDCGSGSSLVLLSQSQIEDLQIPACLQLQSICYLSLLLCANNDWIRVKNWVEECVYTVCSACWCVLLFSLMAVLSRRGCSTFPLPIIQLSFRSVSLWASGVLHSTHWNESKLSHQHPVRNHHQPQHPKPQES